MARLPIDLMTATDRQIVPSGQFNVQTASAADFGGSIGKAMSDAGDAGLQLAVKLQANEKKVQHFNYERQFLELQEQDATAYSEKMRGVSGNADGHWQGSREETNTRFKSWLNTLPAQARAEYEAKAQRYVNGRTAEALTDQYKQQDANTRLALTEEQRKAGLQVQQNPQSYEQFAEQQIELIRKSPLTPLEKEQKIADVKNALAFTAESARAQQNPTAVVAAGVGGGFRERIRSKESGGNDNAAATGSSALGRYQFLASTWNQFAGQAGAPAVTDVNRGGPNDPRRNPELQEKVLDQYLAKSTAELTANKLPVTDANLYALHFFGQSGGVKFIRALQSDAGATAATLFPAEAAANRSVFYSGRTQEAKTVQEVYASLTKGFNGAGVTPSPRTASEGNLTAGQNAQVQEAAIRRVREQEAASAAAREVDMSVRRNQTFVDIKEGPSPVETYKEARRAGVITDFADIEKAERVIRDRDKADTDFQTGASLMQGGRSASNPFNKDHRDGVTAIYERGVKNGADPAALAAQVFDRTGIIPPPFATALRGALASDDPGRTAGSLMIAANMLRQNPNAFAGVDGRADIEKAATEYRRRTETLGESTEQAAKSIMADARNPDNMNPVKQEQVQQFRKSSLTQEKIDSRLQSTFSSWMPFSGPALPSGEQRTALASIYSEFASEGFEVHRDPAKALAYADMKVEQQFGVQNGVLMRYPPEKTSLPSLPGIGRKWINEQAAGYVKDRMGVVVDPSQVILVPIERDGVSTSAAFRDGKTTRVKRDDGKPGQETEFDSVPYAIHVMPKDPKQSYLVLDGAFFPDVETYVDTKNAQGRAIAEGAMMLDGFGIPFAAPAHAPELLRTPEQQQRRSKAEAEAQLIAAQTAERDSRARAERLKNPPQINTADEALLYQQLQDSVPAGRPGTGRVNPWARQ